VVLQMAALLRRVPLRLCGKRVEEVDRAILVRQLLPRVRERLPVAALLVWSALLLLHCALLLAREDCAIGIVPVQAHLIPVGQEQAIALLQRAPRTATLAHNVGGLPTEVRVAVPSARHDTRHCFRDTKRLCLSML